MQNHCRCTRKQLSGSQKCYWATASMQKDKQTVALSESDVSSGLRLDFVVIQLQEFQKLRPFLFTTAVPKCVLGLRLIARTVAALTTMVSKLLNRWRNASSNKTHASTLMVRASRDMAEVLASRVRAFYQPHPFRISSKRTCAS